MNKNIPDELQAAIKEFDKKAGQIVQSFADKINNQELPEVIYHYTDAKGLQGIIESGKFWFTDIFKLNDSKELRYGLGIAQKILEGVAENGPQELKIFSKDFPNFVNEGVEKIAHFFVCCFSHEGDDLSQWRIYGDNGCGYALGFDCQKLEQLFSSANNDNPATGTFPVTYAEDELRKIYQDIIDKVIPLVSQLHGRNLTNDDMKGLAAILSLNVVKAAIFFKHKDYEKEQEYRFLQVYPMRTGQLDDVKYLYRPKALIRYKEFDWRSVASTTLKEIVIGPSANCAEAEKFAKKCLRKFHPTGEHGVEIYKSEIPYRTS